MWNSNIPNTSRNSATLGFLSPSGGEGQSGSIGKKTIGRGVMKRGVPMFVFLILLFGTSFSSQAQSDSTEAKPKRKFNEIVNIRGYVKDLRSANFIKLDNITTDNLIHNRINVRVNIIEPLTASVEVRNRIFYGETVKGTPGYRDLVDVDDGQVDMSYILVDKTSFVFLTQIDRAWLRYSHDKFDLTLGRQRINWGINTVWNPNDLFNAYNYVDFDYEERPGTDGLRFQYYFKNLSSFELAISPDESIDSTIAAVMYKFNKWTYDVQVIAGNYNQDVTLGLGWAGNIKLAGFKGEATYFHPRDNFRDTTGVINASLAFDYAFKNSIYAMLSGLYNSQGLDNSNPLALAALYSNSISPKNMMPSKYSVFGQVSYPFTPLINGGLAGIYGIGLNLLFINPTIGISVANNWELMFVGQIIYAENFNAEFKNLFNSVFVRLKWSFSN